MSDPVLSLSLWQVAVAFIPVAITLVVFIYWSLNTGRALYALARMLVQLLLIGYVLSFIFEADSPYLVLLVLAIMLLASALIALNTVPEKRRALLLMSIIAMLAGGGSTLCLMTQGVLDLSPWYEPRYMVPLAGMMFANAMTAISLAAERLYAELKHGQPWQASRIVAFQAAMIPVINALFAVGLVSLPGMMTGQILSGVSPLIAARYQIVIMCMLFAGSGIAVMVFLWALGRRPGLWKVDNSVCHKSIS